MRLTRRYPGNEQYASVCAVVKIKWLDFNKRRCFQCTPIWRIFLVVSIPPLPNPDIIWGGGGSLEGRVHRYVYNPGTSSPVRISNLSNWPNIYCYVRNVTAHFPPPVIHAGDSDHKFIPSQECSYTDIRCNVLLYWRLYGEQWNRTPSAETLRRSHSTTNTKQTALELNRGLCSVNQTSIRQHICHRNWDVIYNRMCDCNLWTK